MEGMVCVSQAVVAEACCTDTGASKGKVNSGSGGGAIRNTAGGPDTTFGSGAKRVHAGRSGSKGCRLEAVHLTESATQCGCNTSDTLSAASFSGLRSSSSEAPGEALQKQSQGRRWLHH